MRPLSKRITGAIAAASLVAVIAVPASAQTAQQISAQLLQQQQQQAQQQQLQDQIQQQAQQQQQLAQQQQQAWQLQAAQQQQQQQQWFQQQQAYNYGYYGGVNPTLLGLAFWTGQPYTHWACELGVDFQCPATRAAARAGYTTAAPDDAAAPPTHRHRSRHMRHRASEAHAASR